MSRRMTSHHISVKCDVKLAHPDRVKKFIKTYIKAASDKAALKLGRIPFTDLSASCAVAPLAPSMKRFRVYKGRLLMDQWKIRSVHFYYLFNLLRSLDKAVMDDTDYYPKPEKWFATVTNYRHGKLCTRQVDADHFSFVSALQVGVDDIYPTISTFGEKQDA